MGGSGGIRAMQWLFFNHFCTMPSLTGILLDPPLFALTSMSYSNSEAEKKHDIICVKFREGLDSWLTWVSHTVSI